MSRARASAASSWAVLLAYVACVLGSLAFARDLALALRDLHLLKVSIAILYGASLVLVIHHLIWRVRLTHPWALLGLAALAAIAVARITALPIPEERLHFLEYGVMAWLFRAALAWHFRPAGALLLAFALTSGVGVVDELVQEALPNRLYDLADIYLNMQAALLGVLSDELIHNRLGLRSQAVKPRTERRR